MDRLQVTLLASMSGAFVTMVLSAFVVGGLQSSNGGGVSNSPIPADKPLKYLRAKTGTQRKNARALIASREGAPGDVYAASKRNEPLRIWGSPEKNEPRLTPPRDILLNRATPVEALQMAMESLEEMGGDALS